MGVFLLLFYRYSQNFKMAFKAANQYWDTLLLDKSYFFSKLSHSVQALSVA
jgi:hypothetical protein